MIPGYISPRGIWKIRIALFHELSPPNAYDQWFEILIDTGAEVTVLSLTAAIGTGYDFDHLPTSNQTIAGVNGEVMRTWKLNRAGLVFNTAEGFHIETCNNLIVADTRSEDWFGILGRDILNRFDISTDMIRNKVYLNRIESINPELFRVIGQRE